MHLFSFYLQANDVGEMHSLVPGTVNVFVSILIFINIVLNIRTSPFKMDAAVSSQKLKSLQK